MEIKEIQIEKIKADKNQPRKTFDEENLKHLAESILSNGLLNPIEVDSDFVITDGERRYRACKLAKIKTVTCRIVKVKDDKEKLRRQMILTLQDETMPTDEKYEAIVKLWKADCSSNKPQSDDSRKWCKSLGTTDNVLGYALDHVGFKVEEPELAKAIAPSIIAETRYLPKKERKEILEELKKNKEKGKKVGTIDAVRALVKAKKEQVDTKKMLEELRKKSETVVEARKLETKVITDAKVLKDIRDGIFSTHKELSHLMARIGQIRKTKFYLYKAKDKEDFLTFLGGASERARKWADELDDLRETIWLEVVKE